VSTPTPYGGIVRPKREIRASDFVRDIRDGLSNHDLMERYKLSTEGLRSVFRKLLDARVVKASELETRMQLMEDRLVNAPIRQMARCSPVVMFPIYDMDDLSKELLVRDISEKGVRVVGSEAKVASKKTFLIQAMPFKNIDPLIFSAECKWVQTERTDSGETLHVAGFEIVNIDSTDLEQLQKLISSLASCD
jgi:hypothetical protein